VTLGTVKPQLGSVYLSGTNLVLAGGGSAAGYGFTVLASTNLSVPATNWSPLFTGTCDASGSFVVTNGISALKSQQFYIIRVP
jgi:hypothetical protein